MAVGTLAAINHAAWRRNLLDTGKIFGRCGWGAPKKIRGSFFRDVLQGGLLVVAHGPAMRALTAMIGALRVR